jgi:hypothetical protein
MPVGDQVGPSPGRMSPGGTPARRVDSPSYLRTRIIGGSSRSEWPQGGPKVCGNEGDLIELAIDTCTGLPLLSGPRRHKTWLPGPSERSPCAISHYQSGRNTSLTAQRLLCLLGALLVLPAAKAQEATDSHGATSPTAARPHLILQGSDAPAPALVPEDARSMRPWQPNGDRREPSENQPSRGGSRGCRPSLRAYTRTATESGTWR